MKLNQLLHFLLLIFALTFVQNVHAQYFVAPFGTNPDPYIIYDNGWYYYTGTSGDGVYLKKAKTLEGLKHTTMTKMFGPENGGPCCDYWAPELHKINNIWYIYYTAHDAARNIQLTYVIENTSSDPMSGSWTNRGRIYDSSADYWAIDGTVFETGGVNYFVWSGVAQPSDGDKPQRLYIAKMTNPWTLQAGRTLVSSPQLSWELNGNVNEGPAVIKRNGKIFLTYSANGCWTPDYIIGGLYMTEGGNPLNAGSWTKIANPLFSKFPSRDIYSPGHHTFFTSPDGSETWFVYHATPNSAGVCDDSRTTRAQKVFWDANGFPALGLPDPTGAYLTAPAGEPSVPVGPTLANGIYKITPTSSNKPLDVNGCSPLAGTKVQQWTDNGADCQKWHIIATPDGFYSINSVRGGLALDVSGCSSADAAMVQTWNPTGADCQKWSFQQVSPGVYKIVSKLSGKVLDIQFGGNNDGAALQIYSYLGNAQQHFKIELLQSYSTTSWESHNFPGYFIRHQNGRARIDANVSPAEDGKWRMVPGLAGQGVSFQSVNFPGNYLRHVNGEIWSNSNDGSATFQNDATFIMRPGLADASKVSFESFNYPGNYIRHRNYLLYSEQVTSGTGYSDATFKVSTPNLLPTVSITAPANNATYTAPANITLNSNASDVDGSIAKVEYFNGTTSIGSATVSPYSVNWSNVAAGTYSITAVATDNSGATTTSSSISINVKPNNGTGDGLSGNYFNGMNFETLRFSAKDATLNINWGSGSPNTAVNADQFSARWTGQIQPRYSEEYTFYINSDNGRRVWINNQLIIDKWIDDWNIDYTGKITLTAGQKYDIKVEYFENNGGAGIKFDWSSASQAREVVPTSQLYSNPLPTVNVSSSSTSIVAPANLTLSANASDADGIAKVDFYNGTTLIGTDNTSPYSIAWNNVGVGTYSVTALATDNKGGVTLSSALSINVTTTQTNNAPIVSIASPANNATYTASANISFTANASDSDGNVTNVEYFNGSTSIGSSTASPYSVSWNNVAAGTYIITAKATDNGGAVTTSSAITVKVNPPANQVPSVNITAPANNATYTAPAAITINANASDADGTISKVEFFNGSTSLGSDNSSPYSFAWNNVAAGTYTLTAKATDNAGATTTSSIITVKVNPASTNSCTGVTQYVENGGYVSGSIVQNGGSKYSCKPYPYTGWCNGAAWAYAPGTGSYWQDAWTLVGPCSTRMAFETSTENLIAPNPTTGMITVKMNDPSKITVVNTLGVVVMSNVQVNANSTLDISHLPSGMYHLKIETEEKIITQNLIKE